MRGRLEMDLPGRRKMRTKESRGRLCSSKWILMGLILAMRLTMAVTPTTTVTCLEQGADPECRPPLLRSHSRFSPNFPPSPSRALHRGSSLLTVQGSCIVFRLSCLSCWTGASWMRGQSRMRRCPCSNIVMLPGYSHSEHCHVCRSTRARVIVM